MRRKSLLIIFFIISFNIFLNAKNLKILWWNVKDLFDTINEPLKDDSILSKKEYNDKTNMVSEKIKQINADVVGLSEIENISVLKDIANKSGYPYYYLIEGNDPRGIDICLLSKWEVTYISHKDQPAPYNENTNYKFSRDCSECIFYFNNEKIYILLNHLKSKTDNDEEDLKKQVAQVKGILDIILTIYNKEKTQPNIIVMGDLNSERFSEPLNILEKSGLKIINYLYNEKKLYTYKYQNKLITLDYFILNEILFNKTKYRKLKNYTGKDLEKISDHFPLLLEIDL